jgi:flagellar biosynthesis protein FlhB
MAENDDRQSKTEEPTEKKLSDAVEKGNVPVSREMTTLGSLLAILLICKMLIVWPGQHVVRSLGHLLAGSGNIRLEDREDAAILISQTALHVLYAVLPVLAILSCGGIIASLVQSMPQANSQRITPAWSRISPMSGWKRIFGAQGLVEFLKSLFKFAAVAAIAAIVVKSQIITMLNILETDPASIPRIILDMCIRIVVALCVVSVTLAAADFAWARFKWRRDLRMTRQEIKDEHKQAEGDPLIKFRIRTIARQRTSRRMMAKLPAATMVIANPTHFAVALRYVREEGGAPVVIAKGIDHLALRIRETAETHAIPVVENKPLARALYEQVAIDAAIPAEFYKAVAEIIHFLQLRKMYTAPANRK